MQMLSYALATFVLPSLNRRKQSVANRVVQFDVYADDVDREGRRDELSKYSGDGLLAHHDG